MLLYSTTIELILLSTTIKGHVMFFKSNNENSPSKLLETKVKRLESKLVEQRGEIAALKSRLIDAGRLLKQTKRNVRVPL